MIDILVVSPYSDPDPSVVAGRVLAAEIYIASLIAQNSIAFSVITAFADLVKRYDIPGDYDYWERYCRAMIDGSREIHVLQLEGWEDSVGVQGEIAYAESLGKPIKYVSG